MDRHARAFTKAKAEVARKTALKKRLMPSSSTRYDKSFEQLQKYASLRHHGRKCWPTKNDFFGYCDYWISEGKSPSTLKKVKAAWKHRLLINNRRMSDLLSKELDEHLGGLCYNGGSSREVVKGAICPSKLRELTNSSAAPELSDALRLCWIAGLRVGELLSLKVEDVRLQGVDTPELHISSSGSGVNRVKTTTAAHPACRKQIRKLPGPLFSCSI